MNIDEFKRKHDPRNGSWIPYTIAVCSAVVLYTVLNHLPAIGAAIGSFFSLISPVIIGVVIAYLVTPLIKMIDGWLTGIIKREKARYYTSIIAAFVLIIIFIALVLSMLVPQIIDSILSFLNNINVYSQAATRFMNNIVEIANEHNLDMMRASELMTSLMENAVSFITRNARTVLNRSFSYGRVAGNLVIGIILAWYFLVSKRAIIDGVNRLMRNTMKPQRYTQLKLFFVTCNRIFTNFIIGDIVDAVIVGVVNFLFMSVTGMPYAMLISVVVAVTNLAPTFGPFVGAFIGAFILLFADTGNTILFLIFTLILQLVDGYIIKPRLFGGSMGVPGVWITVGIIVGGKFFGVLGILLAVPLVGIITFFYRRFIAQLEEKHAAGAVEEAENETAGVCPVGDGEAETVVVQMVGDAGAETAGAEDTGGRADDSQMV